MIDKQQVLDAAYEDVFCGLFDTLHENLVIHDAEALTHFRWGLACLDQAYVMVAQELPRKESDEQNLSNAVTGVGSGGGVSVDSEGKITVR
jgi:hypothetical protein